MNKQQILEELLALLEGQGVEVRSEPLGGGGGGLCSVRGKKIFFLDTQAATAETAHLCARAVADIVDISGVYVKPQVREFIEDNIDKK